MIEPSSIGFPRGNDNEKRDTDINSFMHFI